MFLVTSVIGTPDKGKELRQLLKRYFKNDKNFSFTFVFSPYLCGNIAIGLL